MQARREIAGLFIWFISNEWALCLEQIKKNDCRQGIGKFINTSFGHSFSFLLNVSLITHLSPLQFLQECPFP
jgi:hypothetical protein